MPSLRIPRNVTVLKWVFCFVTALCVSVIAFAMSLAIAGAHFMRQSLIHQAARHDTLAGAFVVFGSFNTLLALLAGVCVLFGARRASGSGLPGMQAVLQNAAAACRLQRCAANARQTCAS
jgi:hypothetical protein